MTNVLVTGATTPVGARLVAALQRDPQVGHVLAVGVEPFEQTGLEARANTEYLQTDLASSRRVRELMYGPVRAHGVDCIVHGAVHRRAHDEGRRVRRLNVEATRLLLRLAEESAVRRFVYLGSGAVYSVKAYLPDLVREDQPLDLSPEAPQWVRDRVEADVTLCARMGMSDVGIAVLRCAEVFAADCGSQFYDYLASQVCMRPLGFDPMVNLLSVEDAVRATLCAVHADAVGVFNIPGRDTLPLAQVIRKSGRWDVPVPGPLMGPLYALRTLTTGADFRYDLNRWRFHHSGLLDGGRAREVLGYAPGYGLWYNGGVEPAPVVAC